MKRGEGDIAFVSPPRPGETIDLAAQPINTKRTALIMYCPSKLDPKAGLAVAATP
jgi:hypothetical protein